MSANYLSKIAIVGASGNSGSHMVSSLLATGKHTVTAITREGSKNVMPDGVKVAKVNYDSEDSLISAFTGQDALIITLSVAAPQETSSILIKAAQKAGIKWILPNEYGGPTDEQAARDTMLGPAKVAIRKEIQDLGMNYIAVACSFWHEWSIALGPSTFGFDIPARRATLYDDGTQKINLSTWPQVGRAVASLLSLPVEKQAGGKAALSDYANKFVYITSFATTQREMLASLQRVTGTSDADWTVEHKPAKQVFREGQEKLQTGDRTGFSQLLYSRYFFPGEDAGYFEKRLGLDNDALGLEMENIDVYTKKSIEMAEDGFFARFFGDNK